MPSIQLHILGPAFGLPSIDADCNAAVALCQHVLTPQDKHWEIIPSHSETELPCLVVNDSLTLHGYPAIARHLNEEYSSNVLNPTQVADSTALTTFIQRTAQPLLDTSLYLPYANYSTVRSSFTAILPWHANYTLPGRRRAAAKARTKHLGLSSFDLNDDDAHEDTSNRPSNIDTAAVGKENQGFEAEAHKRASLLLPRRETLRSLLSRPENSGAFRLKALADDFLGPLGDWLGEKEFLLGTEEPTSVDCVAYGFLALMVMPKNLEQGWLGELCRRRYPRLVKYTERMHTRLALETKVENVMDMVKCNSAADVVGRRAALGLKLPWAPPQRSSLTAVVMSIFEGVREHIPLMAPSTTITTISPRKPNALERYGPAFVGITTATIMASVYYAFSTGRLVWPHGEEVQIFGRKRMADYGHLGAALAGLGGIGMQTRSQQSPGYEETEVEMGSPVNLEVIVKEKGDA